MLRRWGEYHMQESSLGYKAAASNFCQHFQVVFHRMGNQISKAVCREGEKKTKGRRVNYPNEYH